MAEYTTTADKLGSLLRAQGKAIATGLEQAGSEAAVAGVPIIVAHTPEAFGDLRKSVHPDKNDTVVDAPHAAAVELGTRPHIPPFGPLYRWAVQIGADDPEALARFVQHKISLFGSEPTLFMKQSLPELAEMFLRIIGEHLGKI